MSDRVALTPVRIAGLELPNRVAVAPMSRVSTSGDGVPTARMAQYYARYAHGGFGLVITEGTYTDQRYSQAYPNQPAIVSAAQIEGWRRVVRAVHEARGRIVLQLMHAGALSQHNRHRTDTIAPSAVPPAGTKMSAYGGEGPYRTPRAATRSELAEAVEGFARSAAAARVAGFDGVEVHGANGYLVDQFLTTYTNVRDDEYGGDPHRRVRFATEVVGAVREAVGADFPVGIRLSQSKVNDVGYRWPGGAREAEVIFRAVAEAGVDYLHLASEGQDWADSATLDDGSTVTRLARKTTGLPVIANGGMHALGRARSILAGGEADLVALGRGALANPDWPLRLAAGRDPRPFEPEILRPDVTLASQDAWEAAPRP
ncbi:oxidoreductase [Saccharomonospora saliphila]|uniref:oxidoreductase n=1 Tax=Saccharomonospora saliphila TaxID=369829 RepID=UPI00039C0251|nr:NADH:flavin oxidoreductase [Saccharomonospora saliphila]